jgi:hypothetical protein
MDWTIGGCWSKVEREILIGFLIGVKTVKKVFSFLKYYNAFHPSCLFGLTGYEHALRKRKARRYSFFFKKRKT